MSLSAIIALGAAVLILLIGYRVYLLDRSNYQYRAFGVLCCLLSWMCFCWYEMEQTQDLATAIFWRRLQSVWTLVNPLIVYCCWRFSSMYLRRKSGIVKQLLYVFMLLPSLFFFTLEVVGIHPHGTVTMLENGSWGLALHGLDALSIARGIWTMLVYGSSIFFIYLVWQDETMKFRKTWLFLLIILLSVGASLTILQNYILSPVGIVLPINESWNTLISVLFFGWALSDFQIFDLKPELAFEQVADSMTNLMLITNANFRVKKISASGLAFFNTDNSKVRNAKLQTVVGVEAANKLIANLRTNIKQEISFTMGDRQVSILFSTSRIYNRKGHLIGYVFIGNDLTDYYQALAKVQRSNTELEKSNQALEKFAFAVSHDLKEPLRTVSGFINLLDRQLKTEDFSIQEYLYHINQGIIRMNAMIDSILEISRLGYEQEVDDRVSLERVLLEITDRLRGLLQQKNAIIRYDDRLPTLYGKYQQVSMLFQNLIENGLKYNTATTPLVEISGKETSCGYEFAIRDNGIGIDIDYRKQVFKMFKRLHSWAEYQGTGIGLSMCQKVIELMHGKIWIESREDGKPGTIFKFFIPQEKIVKETKALSSKDSYF